MCLCWAYVKIGSSKAPKARKTVASAKTQTGTFPDPLAASTLQHLTHADLNIAVLPDIGMMMGHVCQQSLLTLLSEN